MANIDAIKNLKETTKDSFDDREKEAVSKISVDDMRGAKAAIESKTFNIDGSSVSLKNIVLGLAVSPDWSGATYKWKKIEAKSELWAALQTLLMINWKSIWAPSIDWTIWPRSAASLQQLQSEMKSADNVRRATEIQQQASERVTMSWLKQFPLGRSFDGVKAGTFNRFKNMQLLNGDWCLRSASIIGTKCTIYYKAEFNNSSKYISVDISKNAYGEVDVRKFVKDIVAKVDAGEKALKLKDAWDKMVAWINDFKESDISDPVVRRWAKLKWINFKWAIDSNGKVVLSSRNNGMRTHLYNPEAGFLKNGKFDKDAFNRTLTRDYYSEALPAVKQDAKNLLAIINKNPASSLNAKVLVDTALATCKSAITTVNAYGHRADFADISRSLNKAKVQYENQKSYLTNKGILTDASIGIIRLASTRESFVANFDKILKEAKKMAVITKKWVGEYEVNYRTTRRAAFDKVGKRAEYTRLVDSIVDAVNGKTYNAWWETITYKFTKINRE